MGVRDLISHLERVKVEECKDKVNAKSVKRRNKPHFMGVRKSYLTGSLSMISDVTRAASATPALASFRCAI